MKLPSSYQNIEIDLPVLNKFLFCLPLRQGLIVCGYLQPVAVIAITIMAIIKFTEVVPHKAGFELIQMIIMFIIMMIINFLDTISSLFLVVGAQKKKANFLEVVYNYLQAKVLLLAGVLVLSFFMKMFVFCDSWYRRNLDDWWYYLLLRDQAFGVIVWCLNFYLLLLVRSEIIHLEHPTDFRSFYKGCWGTVPEETIETTQDTKPIVEESDVKSVYAVHAQKQ